MIKSILIASTLVGAMTAPAFAGGLEGSYANVGAAIGTDREGTAGSVSGRADTKQLGSGVPISIRPQVTIGDATGGNLIATYDIGVTKNVNAFVGAGAGFGAGTAINADSEVVGIVALGVEGEVTKNVVLFADLKFGFGGGTTYTPGVGVGYKF